MGNFFFDESIHDRGQFILGAFVYSSADVSERVRSAIKSAGLRPGEDEFKSSARMDNDAAQRSLRQELRCILHSTKIGLIVLPVSCRSELGLEALRGLRKIVEANGLDNENHVAYFDEGIPFSNDCATLTSSHLSSIEIHTDQDSREIAGLQIADLVAHTLSSMLLEELGVIDKTVKAGNNSGYDPELDINLGFELWATIRYQFFTQDEVDIEKDQLEGFTLDTASYALHITNTCSPELRQAAMARFGTNYVGCIH